MGVPGAFRLVPAGEVDAGAVAGLVNRAYARYRHLFAGLRTTPEELLQEAGPGARFIIVEETGRLIGSALIAPAERFIEPDMLGPSGTPRPGPAGVPEGHPWAGALYFGMAAVEDDRVNRGIGRAPDTLVDPVVLDGSHPAVGLGTVREFGLVPYYERLGYRVIHEAEHPAGHWDFLVPHRYCELVKPV